MSTNSWWLMAFKKHVDIARNLRYQFREIEPIFGTGRNAGSIVINLNCKVIAEISDDREIERGKREKKHGTKGIMLGSILGSLHSLPPWCTKITIEWVSHHISLILPPRIDHLIPFYTEGPLRKVTHVKDFPSGIEHFGTLVASWVGVATKPRFVW